MTNKDKKAWLKRYSAIDRQIKNKTDELAMWRSRATKITPTYSGLPKGGGGDRIQTAVDNICRLEDEINAEIDRLIITRAEINEAIAKVEDERLREVLTLRYIQGKSWEWIAVEMHYNYRWVTKLHGKALSEIGP